jgi:RNA polymerase sigma-70 factor (ECF subfamily)
MIEGDTGDLEALIAQAASVEDQVEFSQLRGAIDAALAALPARQRAAIVQRYYLQMSEKEMAQALEAPPGTVKWLLNAARTRLRTLLGSERSAE